MIIDKQVVFLKDLEDPDNLVFITKDNAEKAGLPLSIICNQYGINADNGSNDDTYVQAGTIGNLNLAYSIEIPNSGIRDITPQTADPFMTTNFASVKTTLNSYNMPIFARSFLINNFYIIKISDFGNQSLSFDSFDFFVKVYYEGRKIPQFRVGLIRRFTSKEAFILIDKRGLPGSVEKDKFSYVIEPITKDAPKDEKDERTTYKQITNNGDRYFNLENYISFLEAQIIYANNSNTDSYKYNLSEIIYDVLMDKRFEVYYKNGENYQKINSKYYASLFASKITKASDKNNTDIISDGDDLTNTNLSSSLVSFQTHHQHPSTRDEELHICNFDYYKYLRDYLYDVKIFDNIDEEMRRTATIALAGIFNVPETTVKNFYILDRSTLPEYYLYEVSGTDEVTLKLTDIFATDITDFEVYYFPVANQATRYIEYGYRLPFASTLDDEEQADNSFTVNKSGEITIKLHSDLVSNYALIEIIPKHDNYSHLVGYCSSEINSIDNIRGMLKTRHIFGFNFIKEKRNSIELYSSNDNGLILTKLTDTENDTGNFSTFDLNISASEELDDSLSTIDENDTALANDSSEYSPITTGNTELLLYTDPMLNLNNSIEDKTSEYILYPNDVSNILTANELKFIRNSNGNAKNKFTITYGTNITEKAEKVDSETDYAGLAKSIETIRDTINSIYENSKTVESNMNMIRDNLFSIFSGNENEEKTLENSFSHSIEYKNKNVPVCIRLDFSGLKISNQDKSIINILEFQLDTNNNKVITKYNFEQYKYTDKIVYVPVYTSPVVIKIFITTFDDNMNSETVKSTLKYLNYNVFKPKN